MTRLLPPYAAVRYSDRYTERWIGFRSPAEWRGKVRVHYRRVPFHRLRPAGSPTHVEVRAYWKEMLAKGEAIPPLVASTTEDNGYYLHDGNHRYCALEEYFGEYGASFARVRVAVVQPVRGYEFLWRWFDGYGTYLLERTGSTETEASARETGEDSHSAPGRAPLMVGASESLQAKAEEDEGTGMAEEAMAAAAG